MLTISQKLFRAVVPGILATLAIGGFTLDALIVRSLEDDFDTLLMARAEALMAITEEENDAIEVEDVDIALPGYSREVAPDWFVLRGANGATLAGSTSWNGSIGSFDSPMKSSQRFADVKLPDGRPGRRVRIAFLPALDMGDDEMIGAVRLPADTVIGSEESLDWEGRPRRAVTLEVAIGRARHETLVRTVHLGLAGTGLTLTLAIVLLARAGIRRTLAPLEDVTHQVAALNESQLDRRLDVPASSTEIDALVERFNALLTRLHAAFERERRFSDDVAHELRTPIAEMRTLLEVSRAFPDDTPLQESFGADLESSTLRMQRIVENLLALARSEAGAPIVVGEPVELAALIDDEIRERTLTCTPERDLQALVSLPDVPSVVPSGQLWSTVVSNLIGNAFAHADTGSTIEVTLAINTDGIPQRFSVSNDASELEPNDASAMFERLWRKDKARTAAEHSGIGLALTRACARQLGYAVRATIDGSRLTVLMSPSSFNPEFRPTSEADQPSSGTVGQPPALFSAGSA